MRLFLETELIAKPFSKNISLVIYKFNLGDTIDSILTSFILVLVPNDIILEFCLVLLDKLLLGSYC
jgi:hypothetical protein